MVNYFDVSLSLNNSNYKPYTNLMAKYYISIKIPKTYPASLNKSPHWLKKRISILSSNETIFNKWKKYTKNLWKNQTIGKLGSITPQTKMSAAASEIENEILFRLILHLVLTLFSPLYFYAPYLPTSHLLHEIWHSHAL